MADGLEEKLEELSWKVDSEKDLEFIKNIISEESNGMPVDEEVYSLTLDFCYTKTRDLLVNAKLIADHSEHYKTELKHFIMSQKGKSSKSIDESDALMAINRTRACVNSMPILVPFMENELYLPSWRHCQVAPRPDLSSIDTPGSDDDIDPSGLLKMFPEGYEGDDDDDEFGLHRASVMGLPEGLDSSSGSDYDSDFGVDKARKISSEMPTSPKKSKLESPNKGKVNSPPPPPPAPPSIPTPVPAPAPASEPQPPSTAAPPPPPAPAPAPPPPPPAAPLSRAAALAAANRSRLSAATASALEMALAPLDKRAKIQIDDILPYSAPANKPKGKQSASKSAKSKSSSSPNSKKTKSKESGPNAGDEKSTKSKSTKNDKPNDAKKTGSTPFKEKSKPVTPVKPNREASPSNMDDVNPDEVHIPVLVSSSSSGVNSNLPPSGLNINLPKINIIQNFKRDLNAKPRRRR